MGSGFRRFQDIPDGGDGSAVQDPGKLHLLFPVHPPDLFCQAADLLERDLDAASGYKRGSRTGQEETEGAASIDHSTETMLPPFTMMVIYSFHPWLKSAAWAV